LLQIRASVERWCRRRVEERGLSDLALIYGWLEEYAELRSIRAAHYDINRPLHGRPSGGTPWVRRARSGFPRPADKEPTVTNEPDRDRDTEKVVTLIATRFFRWDAA
jgi:hypothetical protein